MLGAFSVIHEIACSFSIPHLVITGAASTVRKLSARSAERKDAARQVPLPRRQQCSVQEEEFVK
jgi:hypothetical protein